MSDEPLVNEFPLNAESIAAALAHVAIAQGDAPTVTALAVSIPRLEVIGYEDGSGNRYRYPGDCDIAVLALYLEVPAASFGQISHVREEIQSCLWSVFRSIVDAYPHFNAAGVHIVPALKAPANWHEQALSWLRGEGVNNQGRVRSDNIAARQYDGLLFRTKEEINLYRAFKALGVTFAPLPVFVRGGNGTRRIEPDFVIVKGGMIAVIEVDGPIHRESPVDAHNRLAMLAYEGAHTERIRSEECSTMENAEICAKRILAALAKVKAAH
jgi:hypothetical protein